MGHQIKGLKNIIIKVYHWHLSMPCLCPPGGGAGRLSAGETAGGQGGAGRQGDSRKAEQPGRGMPGQQARHSQAPHPAQVSGLTVVSRSGLTCLVPPHGVSEARLTSAPVLGACANFRHW